MTTGCGTVLAANPANVGYNMGAGLSLGAAYGDFKGLGYNVNLSTGFASFGASLNSSGHINGFSLGPAAKFGLDTGPTLGCQTGNNRGC